MKHRIVVLGAGYAGAYAPWPPPHINALPAIADTGAALTATQGATTT